MRYGGGCRVSSTACLGATLKEGDGDLRSEACCQPWKWLKVLSAYQHCKKINLFPISPWQEMLLGGNGSSSKGQMEAGKCLPDVQGKGWHTTRGYTWSSCPFHPHRVWHLLDFLLNSTFWGLQMRQGHPIYLQLPNFKPWSQISVTKLLPHTGPCCFPTHFKDTPWTGEPVFHKIQS